MIQQSETVIPQRTEVIPASVQRASARYSFDDDPVVVGDVVEIFILVNGREVERIKTLIENEPNTGMELRPVVNFNVVEMAAFSVVE
jgi:hypothetical protein